MTREVAKDWMIALRTCHLDGGTIANAFTIAIEALEQPEIIRCKDCKYCVDYGMGGYYCESEDIVPVGNYVEPSGFCNFARRREE